MSPAPHGRIQPDRQGARDELPWAVEYFTAKVPDNMLRDAVNLICLDPLPPSTVEGLATRLHISSNTLHKHWRLHVSGRTTMKAMQDRTTIMRMLEIADHCPEGRRGVRRLSALAAELRISTRTLIRMPPRCFQLTVPKCLLDPSNPRAQFRSWWIATVDNAKSL